MEKAEIAAVLERIGEMLEILGENKFKCLAYAHAARALSGAPQSVADLIESGRLGQLKGIGSALEEKITTLHRTGSLPYYEELAAQVPAGVVEMLAIPGFGPKKARAVWQELGASSVGELEYACRENRLLHLPGFGEKTQEKVLAGIAFLRKHAGRVLYPVAEEAAEEMLPAIEGHSACLRVALAGSLRRRRETVKDVDIVAASDTPAELLAYVAKLPAVHEVLGQGETKTSVRVASGLQVDVRAVARLEYPFALHHFTGSKEHNTLMRARAKAQGLKMNEYGLFRGDQLILCMDEAEIFEVLGLSYIPPELREGTDELELAETGDLPQLIEEQDLRGVFHVHSHYSDGRGSLEEIARTAAGMGYAYVGIADHSRSAAYARGLSAERLHEQREEILRVNRMKLGCELLAGVESDILADGSLDYDEETLAGLDFVIASVHSRFNLSARDQTRRIIAAVRNPHCTMLGHPSGRLLLSRDPYPVEMEAVLEACAEAGVVVEINANPHRLDLDWRLGTRARELGVVVAINPDAHSPEGLADTRFGVYAARRGRWGPAQVLNTRALPEVRKLLEGRKT